MTRKYLITISVMSGGVVVQAGPPYTLLTEEEGGMFSEMVAETGRETRDKLLEMARQKHTASK